MLKKLQNLLFEEEEEIVEEVSDYSGVTASIPLDKIDENAKVASSTVKETVKEAVDVDTDQLKKSDVEDALNIPTPEVSVEEVEKKMQRIDVTQATPTQKEAVKVEVEEKPTPVEKPKKLGIMADDNLNTSSPRPRKKPSTKPSKKNDREPKTTYQFQPVISPIFGVDEKDLTALKNTTTRISQSEKARFEENVTPIISPIYGRNEEDVPSSIQSTVEKSNYQEQFRVTADKKAAEEDIPAFSLDDILSNRDDENPTLDDFIAPVQENTDTLFPDLWSTELEDAEDSTSIIEHQPTED